MDKEEADRKSSKSKRKFLWIIVFTFSLGGFTYQSYKFMKEYFRYPVIFTSRIVIGRPIEFPSVTFCSHDKFQKSKFLNSNFCKKSNSKLCNNPDDERLDPTKSKDGIFYPNRKTIPPPRNFRFCKSLKAKRLLKKMNRQRTRLNKGTNISDSERRDRNESINGTKFQMEIDYDYPNNSSGGAYEINFEQPNKDDPDAFPKDGFNENSELKAIKIPRIMREIEGHASREELIEMGFDYSTIFKRCFFMGRICTEKNFTRIYDFHFGNCWTFKPTGFRGGPAKVPKPGPQFGFMVELFNSADVLDELKDLSGFRITIHDRREIPFPNENGIDADLGKQTSIKMTKGKKIWLPKPHYTNCYDQDVYKYLNRQMQSKNINYQTSICNKYCLQNAVSNACGCIDPTLDFEGCRLNRTICNIKNQTQICCLEELFDSLKNGIDCGCTIPCKENIFSTKISGISWKPPKHEHNSDDVDQLAKVKIFFQTLDVNVDKLEAKYQLVDIFSNIGGQIGLWLGISLVALYEAGEALCIHSYAFLKKKFGKKERSNDYVLKDQKF